MVEVYHPMFGSNLTCLLHLSFNIGELLVEQRCRDAWLMQVRQQNNALSQSFNVNFQLLCR